MHDPDLLFSFMVKPQNLKEGGSFLLSKHLGKQYKNAYDSGALPQNYHSIQFYGTSCIWRNVIAILYLQKECKEYYIQHFKNTDELSKAILSSMPAI